VELLAIDVCVLDGKSIAYTGFCKVLTTSRVLVILVPGMMCVAAISDFSSSWGDSSLEIELVGSNSLLNPEPVSFETIVWNIRNAFEPVYKVVRSNFKCLRTCGC